MFVATCGDEVVVIDTGFDRAAGERRGRTSSSTAADAVRAAGRRRRRVARSCSATCTTTTPATSTTSPTPQVVAAAGRARLRGRPGDAAPPAQPLLRGRRRGRASSAGCSPARCTVVEGDHELRPGFELHLVAGHTRGLQVVRVHTERGWIVLACDGVHYFDNLAERNPFPALVDVEQVLDGYERIEALADSPAHIVPGHDPRLFDALRARARRRRPHHRSAAPATPRRGEHVMITDAETARRLPRLGARLRRRAARARGAGARTRGRLPARRRAAAGEAGPARAEHPGGARRAGRRPDGRQSPRSRRSPSQCPRSADIVQAGNFGPIRTFAQYASDDQRARYLAGLLSGDLLMSLGMSEPGAGLGRHRAHHQRRRADGDGWLINGTKVFSTHSADADVYLVYVRFGPGVDGIGSVLVDRGTPGPDDRPAVALHERRALVPAVLRQLPHRSRAGAARRGRVQAADQRLQRRAARQQRALDRGRPLRLRRGQGATS